MGIALVVLSIVVIVLLLVVALLVSLWRDKRRELAAMTEDCESESRWACEYFNLWQSLMQSNKRLQLENQALRVQVQAAELRIWLSELNKDEREIEV